MLDQAKSSAIPRGTLAGTAPQPPGADPSPASEGLSRLAEAAAPIYSIRIAEEPGTKCATCGKQETGEGPVGYMDDLPICDLCLIERSTDLGLMMGMSAVARAYAGSSGTDAERYEALHELGIFARIYHRVSSWPARIFRIPGFTAKNDTTH